MNRAGNNDESIKTAFAGMEGCFDFAERIETDPVRFVRPFENPLDRQAAGLIASCFAYGAVGQIGVTLDRIFSVLGPNPSVFIDEWTQNPRRIFDGFYHRFNNRDDLLSLLYAIGTINREYGSLNGLFLENHKEGAIEEAMDRFADRLLSAASDSPFTDRRALSYFFPSPRKGSTCKRMCLYLRWMNRRDTVDPGGWTGVGKRDLIIPVDTHISRIGRYLGFTKRKNADWKMAVEITEALRRINPDDPLSLDFIICHMGISGRCPVRQDKANCEKCPLKRFCRSNS